MKVALLMVTYARDLPFARYSFRSVAKFASGFADLVVVVPSVDIPAFEEAAHPFGFRVVGFHEAPGKGMLHHQERILHADQICFSADAILHMDADCMFTEPVTPGDYMRNGKPVMWREPFESFRDYEARYSWKECVRNATGIDPVYECMCRHPSIHLRYVYAMTRAVIEVHTGMSVTDYMLSGKNDFPQDRAEFPTLGAVALEHYGDLYHWVDCAKNEPIDPSERKRLVKEFWSHAGLDKETDRHPGQTARQVCEAILK